MKKIVFCLILIMVVYHYSRAERKEGPLLWLKNDKAEVGLLPSVGGKVVAYRLKGLENVFYSDSSLWGKEKPEVGPYADFEEYNGHTVWVGPQNEWWTKQDLNPERKKLKSSWPPDPYLIYGDYQVSGLTSTSVVLTGEPSPISGVRLIKEIDLNEDGSVSFTAKLTPIDKKGARWDIWMNTRMRGYDEVFVPIGDEKDLMNVMKETKDIETTPYQIIDGFFTFSSSPPKKGKKEQVQESHMDPSAPFMVGKKDGQLLVIRFDDLGDRLCSPGHSPVEIYNYRSRSGAHLLELEAHGEYKEVTFGDTLSFKEEWEIVSIPMKIKEKKDISAFLRKNIK